jgi:hypothetical protein
MGFYQRWAFFTEVDILYKSKHCLQRWVFFIEEVNFYRGGQFLYVQNFVEMAKKEVIYYSAEFLCRFIILHKLCESKEKK